MSLVLVTDPDQRACLACARALSAVGHRVLSFGPAKGLAGWSNAVERHVTGPSSLGRREDYVAAVAQAVEKFAVDLVIPISDAASDVLLERSALLKCRVAGPDIGAYRRASDKLAIRADAEDVGILVPKQVIVNAPNDLGRYTHDLQFPIIVKPSRSVGRVGDETTKLAVTCAASIEELHTTVNSLPEFGFPVMLQERIIGEGVGVFLLRSGGHTLARFAHRRIREKPPSGGVSTYRVAVSFPETLGSQCEQLLDRIQFDGAAMIELKRDARTGNAYLMEINGRLWGSLQLATDAGVNFPSALVQLFLAGSANPTATDYAIPTGLRWELGEIDHLLAVSRASNGRVLESGTASSMWRTIAAVLSIRRGDRLEVFRLTDPLPFAFEAAYWLRALA